MARAREVDMRDAVGIFDAVVASETVQHEGETLIAFHVARTFEEFVERRADEVARGRHEARHWNFIRQLSFDQAVVVCEVNVQLHVQRRARGGRRVGDRRR